MEQFDQFMQGDPNYEHCGYAGEEYIEIDPSQEYFTGEQALLAGAHIPGLQGRAATMGAALGHTIFGNKFGIDPTAPLNTDTIETEFGTDNEATQIPEPAPLPPDSTCMFAEPETPARTCVNPFTKAAPTLRSKITSENVASCVVAPLLWLLQICSLMQHMHTPRTRNVVLTVFLVASLCTWVSPHTVNHTLCPRVTMSHALSASFGMTTSTLNHYLLDSGCSTSIIADTQYLRNIRPMMPVTIRGLTGTKVLDLQADLHLPVRTATNTQHTISVQSVFYDPDGHYNLVSSDQLNASAYDVLLTRDPRLRSLHFTDENRYPRHIPINKVGKLFNIPVQHPADIEQPCLLANCGNMSLEELFHLRMAHTPYGKLASMSPQVNGLPRPLQYREALRLPCNLCQEAKATRQNAPPASKTVSSSEHDLVTWDLIDMGDKFTTFRGNRYISLFIIHRSRFAITILHKDRTDFKSVLLRAFTKCGFTPKVVRSDGAAEYLDQSLHDFFVERGIEHQITETGQAKLSTRPRTSETFPESSASRSSSRRVPRREGLANMLSFPSRCPTLLQTESMCQ
mmetsp:Transcript_61737/g.127622  ORF Transcript_61737/g.127622 Transcript_61737/m.127622 type:complete len:569 (+) Transcript_61737:1829-3535(+)